VRSVISPEKKELQRGSEGTCPIKGRTSDEGGYDLQRSFEPGKREMEKKRGW